MNLVIGIGIITGVYLAGELISRTLQLTMPGGVLGMLLLFGLIVSGVVPLTLVEDAAKLLLDNLILFFVPTSVGVMVYFDLITSYWSAIAAITILSFLAVLSATGVTVQAIVRFRKECSDE